MTEEEGGPRLTAGGAGGGGGNRASCDGVSLRREGREAGGRGAPDLRRSSASEVERWGLAGGVGASGDGVKA